MTNGEIGYFFDLSLEQYRTLHTMLKVTEVFKDPWKSHVVRKGTESLEFKRTDIQLDIFDYLQDCVVADMCLRLLVLGLHDQATVSLIEIVFAIVRCVLMRIYLIAQWLSQCPLSCSVWKFLFGPPRPLA